MEGLEPVYEEWGGRKRKCYPKECLWCEKTFYIPAHMWEKYRCCSSECSQNLRHERNRVSLDCAVCGESFKRNPSEVKRSKHGVYFCSRKCKDEGQSISQGIAEIMPPHYGNGSGVGAYRRIAFSAHGKKCSMCGYDETPKMMDVHHIDRNRENNDPSNLQVLCVWCHQLIHRGVEFHGRVA